MTVVRFALGLAPHDAAGRIELRAQALPMAPPAVRRALALEPVLPLLAALEPWLGRTWHTLEPAAAEGDAWPGDDEALTLDIIGHGRLALPWRWLRPGVVLRAAGFELVWPAWRCEWLVERVGTPLEPDALASGSLLLLRGSFAPPWRWTLRPSSSAAPTALTWAMPAGDHTGWQVCTDCDTPVSVEHWFGRAQAPPAPDTPTTAWLRGPRDAGRSASGCLRRVGHGHALEVLAWT